MIKIDLINIASYHHAPLNAVLQLTRPKCLSRKLQVRGGLWYGFLCELLYCVPFLVEHRIYAHCLLVNRTLDRLQIDWHMQ